MTPSKTIEIGLNTVTSRAVEWLWPNRIPSAKLTILMGDPGAGKSFVSMDMAARVSVGKPWPSGEPCEAGKVVILGQEDDLDDTVKPRIEVLGGDPKNIIYIMGISRAHGGSEYPDLLTDLGALRDSIEGHGARLVIIDPLSAYMSGVDCYKDAEVRRVLTPVTRLAKESSCAVVGIMHMNKRDEGSVVYRAQGSIGFMGVARMVYLVGVDKEDKETRHMVPVKSNIRHNKTGLSYRLVDVKHPLGWDVAKVEWIGESDITPEEITGPMPTDEEMAALGATEEFLSGLLERNGGKLSQDTIEKHGRAKGFNVKMLQAAKRRLKVKAVRGPDFWEWSL